MARHAAHVIPANAVVIVGVIESRRARWLFTLRLLNRWLILRMVVMLLHVYVGIARVITIDNMLLVASQAARALLKWLFSESGITVIGMATLFVCGHTHHREYYGTLANGAI